MKKTGLYTKHQAFDIVYKQIKKHPKAMTDGFDSPKKYHHAPDKLEVFTNFKAYVCWANELHAFSTQLISLLRDLYNKSKTSTSSWNANKKHLNNILNEYDELKSDLENLYDDIFEFQNCMLATSINQKHAEIEALSDQTRYLTALENNIVDTCNRKLYEISSSRFTFANMFIAIVALLISLFSLYSPCFG